MKKPCLHCPFRLDVRPFLHPEKAWDIASVARNTRQTFPCHKTTCRDEEGDTFIYGSEKECAGMLTLRARETDEGLPEGFEPSFDVVYEDPFHMADAYEDQWNSTRKPIVAPTQRGNSE
jgi:hypothetical protein